MSKPFSGLRVIDLSAVVSGPMATGILADQGADVIKVEPMEGDLTRLIGPAKGDLSALFISINRGKRSIVLDLKKPEGAKVLRDLLLTSDVLVENFQAGRFGTSRVFL
ncbi:MAG: CoA transferase [Betaproteobacteria bacterium]|nr:CoA transferase [Betaproteobacteria bacterium]